MVGAWTQTWLYCVKRRRSYQLSYAPEKRKANYNSNTARYISPVAAAWKTSVTLSAKLASRWLPPPVMSKKQRESYTPAAIYRQHLAERTLKRDAGLVRRDRLGLLRLAVFAALALAALWYMTSKGPSALVAGARRTILSL